jgi:hypothetical protein
VYCQLAFCTLMQDTSLEFGRRPLQCLTANSPRNVPSGDPFLYITLNFTSVSPFPESHVMTAAPATTNSVPTNPEQCVFSFCPLKVPIHWYLGRIRKSSLSDFARASVWPGEPTAVSLALTDCSPDGVSTSKPCLRTYRMS